MDPPPYCVLRIRAPRSRRWWAAGGCGARGGWALAIGDHAHSGPLKTEPDQNGDKVAYQVRIYKTRLNGDGSLQVRWTKDVPLATA